MLARAPRITKKEQVILFKCFCLDQTATAAASLASVNRHTADLWFRHWRERIYTSLRKAPRFLGEVEMDQKFFGGRRKKKRDADRAAGIIKAPENKIQVFGIMVRSGDVYTHVIKKADARTLVPIIRLVVEQGSIVYTDEWRSFSRLGLDGYTHRKIKHAAGYKNKEGIHINSIESFWSYCQRRLAKFNGLSRRTLPLHIKECEFRFNHRTDLGKAIKSLEQ